MTKFSPIYLRQKIKDLEHSGDEIVHEIHDNLHNSFIAPFDHEDISVLISRIDDVLDHMYTSVNRIYLYRFEELPEKSIELFTILIKAIRELDIMISNLHKFNRNFDAISKSAIEINRLENEADDVLNAALVELFSNSKDAVSIIKLKEIYEHIENATDMCEDAANIINNIVMKHR